MPWALGKIVIWLKLCILWVPWLFLTNVFLFNIFFLLKKNKQNNIFWNKKHYVIYLFCLYWDILPLHSLNLAFKGREILQNFLSNEIFGYYLNTLFANLLDMKILDRWPIFLYWLITSWSIFNIEYVSKPEVQYFEILNLGALGGSIFSNIEPRSKFHFFKYRN